MKFPMLTDTGSLENLRLMQVIQSVNPEAFKKLFKEDLNLAVAAASERSFHSALKLGHTVLHLAQSCDTPKQRNRYRRLRDSQTFRLEQDMYVREELVKLSAIVDGGAE